MITVTALLGSIPCKNGKKSDCHELVGTPTFKYLILHFNDFQSSQYQLRNALKCWPSMNSPCQFIFVQNIAGFMPDLGSSIPPQLPERWHRNHRTCKGHPVYSRLIHQKGIMLSPRSIHIKSVWVLDKWTQHPATATLGNTGVQEKLLLPTVSQDSCSLPPYYKPTKTVRRGVKKSAWYDNYRLHWKTVLLSRVSQPAHAMALRRKNSLCSTYDKETTIRSMEDKGKNMYRLYSKAAKQLLPL